MLKVILAFDLGGTYLKYGIGTNDGEIIHHAKRDSGGKGSIETIASAFKAAALEMKETAVRNNMTLTAVSIGTPGAVDKKTGAVFGSSPNVPAVVGLSLQDIIREELALPVVVENDANLATLGEAIKGAGAGYRSVLGLTLGTGLGGGFVFDGNIYRGAHGSALEIGHSSIDYNGRICNCGKPGHIEAYASGSAIMKRANELEIEIAVDSPRKFPKSKPVFQAALEGYEPAVIAVREAVDALSVFLANMINIVDPSCIVIGGGVMFGYLDYWDELKRKVADKVADSLTGKTPILPAELGNMAGMVGAVLNAGRLSSSQ